MNLLSQFDAKDLAARGRELHDFAAQLYPICRSITGEGTRRTLRSIENRVPLQTFEVPSGTRVFDWTVPKEWNIRDAYIADASGKRVVDFQQNNLHVLNYSTPIHQVMPLSDLRQHLFTLPEQPELIPYRTSYYRNNWGFCLSHNQLLALPDGEYQVHIDSTLEDGHLTYAECFLPGRVSDEVLISCHICHPSLANDNLSGITVATALAQFLSGKELRYSYRFVFLPGTIGAITWLARNRANTRHIRHGLVLTCLGDQGKFHYKKSRRGNSEIDRIASHVLQHSRPAGEVMEFSPYGYDERQYCSPGFNLPVGCLMRSVWGTFPEYHTSADNLDFIQPQALAESLRACVSIFDAVENNLRYRNTNPYCEPQLGKRNLYSATGGTSIESATEARLWVLNFSDGEHSLLDIAERANLPFAIIRDAAEVLRQNRLLTLVADQPEKEKPLDDTQDFDSLRVH